MEKGNSWERRCYTCSKSLPGIIIKKKEENVWFLFPLTADARSVKRTGREREREREKEWERGKENERERERDGFGNSKSVRQILHPFFLLLLPKSNRLFSLYVGCKKRKNLRSRHETFWSVCWEERERWCVSNLMLLLLPASAQGRFLSSTWCCCRHFASSIGRTVIHRRVRACGRKA